MQGPAPAASGATDAMDSDNGLRREMLDCLRARGVWDREGKLLSIPDGAVPAVVGRVADDEPLFATEAAVASEVPHLIVRGLGAVAMLSRAGRVILAVATGARDVLTRLKAEVCGSRVELVELPPSTPMDRDQVICDLAQRAGQSVPAAGLDRALVLDAVELRDVALALAGAGISRSRFVTVAGAVREPAVVAAPVGTPVADLVARCGGCADPGWLAWHNGVLRGAAAGWDQVVEPGTRGVVVLQHDHPLRRRSCTPVGDLVRRIPSACASCRICTDACPVFLAGGQLAPHDVMRAVAAAQDRPAVVGALECTRCGICTALCPARLAPALVIAAAADGLGSRGVELCGVHALRPHPDRPGRRMTVERLAAVMGIGRSVSPRVLRHLVPDHLRLPLMGGRAAQRVPVVQPGQQLAAGELVALAPAASLEPDLHSPLSGRVVAVDLEDGVLIKVR